MFNVKLSVVMFQAGLSKLMVFGSSFCLGLTCFTFQTCQRIKNIVVFFVFCSVVNIDLKEILYNFLSICS